jgi:3-oxoacyl-[acyl-carrier protein] reductase
VNLLDQKCALVTGGAGGIGLAIAKIFSASGANVVIADLNEDSARTSAAALETRSSGIACDVRNATDIGTAVAHASEEFGHLDIVVNNAGVTRDSSLRRMLVDDFDAVLDVHLRGAFLMTKASSEVMRGQGSGSIINISSISGKVGMVGQANYRAAKAGLIGLTKSNAKELAKSGIRVNAIQPGLIRTPMTAAMPQQVWDQKMAEIPMGRAGEPEEVAQVALFLASALSSYITGAVLEVSGGRFM